MLRIRSSGTGSGLSRRIARVVWMISNMSVPSGIPFSFSPRSFEPYRDGGTRDHRDVPRLLVDHVQTAFDDVHRDMAVGQYRLYSRGIYLLRPLNADRDLDLHRPGIDPERADEGERAVVNGILDRAHRSLGVVAAVQIVAAAHLQDDAFSPHAATSRNVEPNDRSGVGDDRRIGAGIVDDFEPAFDDPHRPVPCGNTATTACWSTWSGRGTP